MEVETPMKFKKREPKLVRELIGKGGNGIVTRKVWNPNG